MKRREFMRQTAVLGTLAGTASLPLFNGCSGTAAEITPAEDLAREHGVLTRIMLIYDECLKRTLSGGELPAEPMLNTAMIVRNFIEDYHEQLEELYVFPRFLKANILAGLVQALWIQHSAGRKLTDHIIEFGKSNAPADQEAVKKVTAVMNAFNRMYRVHHSREDTVLFPAIREIVSSSEYDSMGTEFENKERELFGGKGFETIVSRIEEIEKTLGIFEISFFNPAVELTEK